MTPCSKIVNVATEATPEIPHMAAGVPKSYEAWLDHSTEEIYSVGRETLKAKFQNFGFVKRKKNLQK